MTYTVFNVFGDVVDTFRDYESANSFCVTYSCSIGTCYLSCPDKDIEYPAK